jgi:hypothetical protein
MASDVVRIRVKFDLSLALAGISGMVKIDHIRRNPVVFLLALASLDCIIVVLRGGIGTAASATFPISREAQPAGRSGFGGSREAAGSFASVEAPPSSLTLRKEDL